MTDRIGVVSVALPPILESEDWWHTGEAIFKTVQKVREDTGLTFATDGTGIDSTVTSTWGLIEGTFMATYIEENAGNHRRHAVLVTSEGANALQYAMVMILTGKFDVILVTSYIKESKAELHIAENFAYEPIFHQGLGLDYLQADAMQARQYMHKYGITPEQCAKVVVKNRRNGLRNPVVRFGHMFTVEDVLGSPMVADPIHAHEIRPRCDGGCTMIIAREDRAKQLTDKPVWLTGISNCYDVYALGERDLSEVQALEKAAKKAYSMAGITNPRKELDLVELSEHCAYQELMWTEGLGLCQRGEGGKLIDSGATQRNGELPVNPSGGVLSGNPVCAAGLIRVAECVLQLRGQAGEKQIDGARKAVAHASAGPAGQLQTVIALEKGF